MCTLKIFSLLIFVLTKKSVLLWNAYSLVKIWLLMVIFF